jgi:hypothetical protein
MDFERLYHRRIFSCIELRQLLTNSVFLMLHTGFYTLWEGKLVNWWYLLYHVTVTEPIPTVWLSTTCDMAIPCSRRHITPFWSKWEFYDFIWPLICESSNPKIVFSRHIFIPQTNYFSDPRSLLRGDKHQTLEGYISKDIYIPYPIQKSRKRIFPYPFFEWDMLKDIISLF